MKTKIGQRESPAKGKIVENYLKYYEKTYYNTTKYDFMLTRKIKLQPPSFPLKLKVQLKGSDQMVRYFVSVGPLYWAKASYFFTQLIPKVDIYDDLKSLEMGFLHGSYVEIQLFS